MYNYNQQQSSDPQYQAAYKMAERRVQAKLGFYSHLTAYVVVNGLLIVLYLVTGPLPGFYKYPWFVWPMFGWGIGLLFHFLGVFVNGSVNSEDNRRRMIEAEMRRMGVNGGSPPANQWPGTPTDNPIGTGSQYGPPPDRP